MRRPADWMKGPDERILEFLDEYGNNTPTQINRRLKDIIEAWSYHPEYIGARCRELAKYGLVRTEGGGVYEITDIGREYLDGDIDASDLERSDSQ